MTVLEILFWLSVFLILYTYLGYGSLMVIFSRFKKRFPRTETAGPDPEPTVTLVVAAFDEGPGLQRKIANALELDYPEEKIRILLIVDGEMDEASRQAACRSGRVAVFQRPERLGKMAAINRAMPGVNTELVVFSDANSMLNREAVRELVRYFADPGVGCVSGEKCVFSRKGKDVGGAGEGIYWRYESRIKSAEAGWGSCIGAVGELYAIRAALFRELPDDTILDDFSISMDIVCRGYRIAYAPGARAAEPGSLTLSEEFERKARISAGGLQSLRRMPGLLNPFRHGVVSFQYLSHKVLRSFLVPPAMFAGLPLNLILLSSGRTVYLVLFLIQLLFYAFVAGGLMSKDKALSSGFLFVPLYVALMNAAALAGACRHIRGRQPAQWKKARREADVPVPLEGDRQ